MALSKYVLFFISFSTHIPAYININGVVNAISTSQETTVLPEPSNVQRSGNYHIETPLSESAVLMFVQVMHSRRWNNQSFIYVNMYGVLTHCR